MQCSNAMQCNAMLMQFGSRLIAPKDGVRRMKDCRYNTNTQKSQPASLHGVSLRGLSTARLSRWRAPLSLALEGTLNKAQRGLGATAYKTALELEEASGDLMECTVV